jgi:citrate/tricarballylate utilization protein
MNIHTLGDSGHATANLKEADRLMTVCNSCRYCEGLCAVFPAMEMRRSFADGDLNYLANLCHSCGACYVDCQFSPPHEFDVNVPRTLAAVRAQSYAHYAWPQFTAPLFRRNGLWISVIAAASVAVFIAGFAAWHQPSVMFGSYAGSGTFYRLMPHNAMALIFGTVFVYALLALALSLRRFWNDLGDKPRISHGMRAFWQAVKDAGSLRYLDGGGIGCYGEDERPTDRRRIFHHLTFYGFVLCFLSTSTATLYHYLVGREAPYAWYDLPVLLGAAGGFGLVIGPAGLLKSKWTRDPALSEPSRNGMDVAFLMMLFLTSVTGLLLLVLRTTAAMPLLLATHLGVVFALFLTMPYGNFVHGLYRFLALVRYAGERNTELHQASDR